MRWSFVKLLLEYDREGAAAAYQLLKGRGPQRSCKSLRRRWQGLFRAARTHYVIQPPHLWSSIANMARTQNGELLNTLQAGFKYIEEESFESTFQGLFSEINLGSDKLGRTYADRNAKLCSIIQKIAEGLNEFSNEIDALGDA